MNPPKQKDQQGMPEPEKAYTNKLESVPPLSSYGTSPADIDLVSPVHDTFLESVIVDKD